MNTSKISPEDPRITAYALGELDGAELAEFEALLANNPHAQSAVNEIRALSGKLHYALAHEPLPPVTPLLKSPDQPASKTPSVASARDPYRRKVVRFPFWATSGLAAAAGVALLLVFQNQQANEHSFASVKKSERAASVQAEIAASTDDAGSKRSQSAHEFSLVGGELHENISPAKSLTQTTSDAVPEHHASNTQSYAFLQENAFNRVRTSPLSTFSVDVDTASYTDMRRLVETGQRPPRDAVRVEELINYFPYRYAPPELNAPAPFSTSMEISAAPWNPAHRLVRIGLKAREIPEAERPSPDLVIVAKDVKLQVEFNPAVAQSYRLIGYENRTLAKEDFNNDKIDAGDVGSGHTVTALYEIVPVGVAETTATPEVDELKYAHTTEPKAATDAASTSQQKELLTLKIRFKPPTVAVSQKIEIPLIDPGTDFAAASKDFKFAAAVAGFGMVLRESTNKGDASYDKVITWAEAGKDEDKDGRRTEFIELVKKAKALSAE